MTCTLDMGQLTPIGCVEVLPGDRFRHSTSALLRTLPLNAPVMHPVHVRIHHFYVPTRIIWPEFEQFITGGDDGEDATVAPYVTAPTDGFAESSLADFLGIRPLSGTGRTYSALPFRAYQKIWTEYYRDQDLSTPAVISTASGSDTTTSVVLRNICWEKDYLTTSRPTPQKGPDVTIPLSDSAPIVTDDTAIKVRGAASLSTQRNLYGDGADNNTVKANGANFTGSENLYFGDNTGLELDAMDLGGSINELRVAYALQRFEENRSRYGSRYTEYLRNMGVISSDARLQRPEYLGGSSQTIQFSEVLQTTNVADTGSSEEFGTGDMYGHGIAGMRSNTYRKYFEEHGFVISLVSIKPKTVYGDAIKRMWERPTKLDYFQHELQHVGQQEVLNQEVVGWHATPRGRFGYQDRYDEYRGEPGRIAGAMRSTLDYWNMARTFDSGNPPPALNQDFVDCTPTNRIYQISTSSPIIATFNHKIIARRIVAPTGAPGGL